MRVLLQRSGAARVDIEGRTVGRIDRGLVVLIGMGAGDTEKMLRPAAEKIVNLRIFGDDTGNMNRSLLDVGAGCSSFRNLRSMRMRRRVAVLRSSDRCRPQRRVIFTRNFWACCARVFRAGTWRAGSSAR
jgi:hypothetical protein